MSKFGLIGFPLGHSFSKRYFTEKFKNGDFGNASYQNYELSELEGVRNLIKNEQLNGINVTIPHKQNIIPFLDELDHTAKQVGAVNTIKVRYDKKEVYLKGYNTDVVGFRNSLRPILKGYHHKALILGTGGASKAVAFVLRALGLEVFFASRNPINENEVAYDDLNEIAIQMFGIIVNTTPLGTHPNVDECPNIPYEYLTERHLLYDLVYNPDKTLFLQKGEEQGAMIKNGYDMLVGQAEAAFDIWSSGT